MSDVYYKVKKTNFMWQEGAILKRRNIGINGVLGYIAIEDIWNTTSVLGTEYISHKIIEAPENAEFFERVYPDTILGNIFRTKDQLLEAYKTSFKA